MSTEPSEKLGTEIRRMDADGMVINHESGIQLLKRPRYALEHGNAIVNCQTSPFDHEIVPSSLIRFTPLGQHPNFSSPSNLLNSSKTVPKHLRTGAPISLTPQALPQETLYAIHTLNLHPTTRSPHQPGKIALIPAMT